MTVHSSPSPNHFDAANAFRVNQMEITACGVDCTTPQASTPVRQAAVDAATKVNQFTGTLHALSQMTQYAVPVGAAAAVGIVAACGAASAPVIAAGAFAGAITAFMPPKSNGRG